MRVLRGGHYRQVNFIVRDGDTNIINPRCRASPGARRGWVSTGLLTLLPPRKSKRSYTTFSVDVVIRQILTILAIICALRGFQYISPSFS